MTPSAVRALPQQSPDASPEDLMAGYQRGDQIAAAALIEHLSPQLYRFFNMQVISRKYAEDLLQETWLRIHRVRHTYRPGEPLLPWLYSIARNVRVDHYRKTRRRESRERQFEQLPQIAAAHPERPRPGPDLNTLLQALPESQREVVTLLKVSGMSLQEVARATASSVGSVKQKAHRAYGKLRQLFANLPATSGGGQSA